MKRLLMLASLLLAQAAAHAQWVLQPFSFATTASYPACVAALSIVDARTVWAIAQHQQLGSGGPTLLGDNEVALTTTGGATWQVPSAGGGAGTGEVYTNIVGLSATTALVCAAGYSRRAAPYSYARILKTTDGGLTWWPRTTTGQFTDPASNPEFFCFFSATEGLCVGDPVGSVGSWFELYGTRDTGNTWQALSTATMPVALPGERTGPHCMAQAGGNVWFSTSAGRVFRSTDRGRTWTVSSTGLAGPACLSFSDSSNGLLNRAGRLLGTTDGGTTWQRVDYAGPLHQLVACVPGTDEYLSVGQGPDAGTSTSRDYGATWTPLETTRSHFALAVFSPGVAWSGAVDYTATSRAGLGAYRLGTLAASTPPAGPAPVVPRLGFTLYPNPSPAGSFTLALASLPAGPGTELRVLDALGRCVLARPVPPDGPASLDLQLERPAPGLYTVQLRTPGALAQQRLLVP